MLIKETRNSGHGDVPLGQLHAKMRREGRLPVATLELAATVAFLLATFKPS
jgi:hypothetical protein